MPRPPEPALPRHGTRARYYSREHCRCELCNAANNRYMRHYREQRRAEAEPAAADQTASAARHPAHGAAARSG